MPKVAFKTLGCRLNQAETDKMAEDLMGLGFSVVAEDERPDVVIVNTCTVTQEASRSSRKMARGATEKNPESLVVVAGCYAVAEPDEAASINGVGMVVTNDQKETIADLLAEKMGISRRPLLQIGRLPSTGPSPGLDRTRVNLKVQTGCDEFCSFCIIPYTGAPFVLILSRSSSPKPAARWRRGRGSWCSPASISESTAGTRALPTTAS